MGKFKRLNLAESEEHFPLLNEDARKTLKGGCDGCSEWIYTYPGFPIYTEDNTQGWIIPESGREVWSVVLAICCLKPSFMPIWVIVVVIRNITRMVIATPVI